MDAQLQEVSLATLGGGAAAELFEAELKRVLANIADPNTEATDVRDIVLKVRLVPNEERTHAAVKIACNSKMAATKPYGTYMFLSSDGRKVSAYEGRPAKQTEMDFGGKVKQFAEGGNA